jgi:diaminopimelate decarboxylase
MDHFSHRDGRMWCEEVPLDAAAGAAGTPLYVYSSRTLRHHARAIRAAFAEHDPLVCYAVKANSNLALLAVLAAEGLGFDIVSGGELDRVRSLGVPGERVVFSGVGKTREEMEAALDVGVLLFNVESEPELDLLEEVARARGRVASVGVRLNPDVDAGTHPHITTGRRENKFGVDLEVGERLARRAARSPVLRLRALQCHIGSQITSPEPFAEALGRVAEVARRLAPEAPDLTWLDMGGGFGIPYQGQPVPGFDDYARAVAPIVRASGLRLLLEPGRVIVGSAGVLLTRVLFVKHSGGKRFVIVDAGMNDLLRPSLYDAWHPVWPVRGPPPPPTGSDGGGEPCDVVGPVCESADFLALARPLPEVRPGDLLAVSRVGAYGFCMSSNYNDRPRAAEVLVDGESLAVVRERERPEDLLRRDRPFAPFRRWAKADEAAGTAP